MSAELNEKCGLFSNIKRVMIKVGQPYYPLWILRFQRLWADCLFHVVRSTTVDRVLCGGISQAGRSIYSLEITRRPVRFLYSTVSEAICNTEADDNCVALELNNSCRVLHTLHTHY